MLLKTVITGLAAAALIVGAAIAPTYARGAFGGANWPQEGTWNYPVTCKWVAVQVKPSNHKRPTWQWVKECQ